MKIKRYNDFVVINESGLPIQIFNLESISELIKENCQDFISYIGDRDYESIRNTLIYRKSKRDYGQFVLVDPKDSKEDRIAPFSKQDYHNIVLSNLNSWKEYPRRNKSLIASAFNRARFHGGGNDLYLVIPYDDTRVGVCPTSDFWTSFSKQNMNINDWFIDILYIIIDDNKKETEDKKSNWKDLKYILTKLEVSDKIKKYFDEYFDDLTLLDNINLELQPKRHDFKLLYPKDVYGNLMNDNEVWMEDNCILIKYDMIQNLFEYLRK